jgi:CPA2 family monovalent cation:H+ antiporter-2
MLIAESGKGRDVDALIRPFRDIFAAIFFISIGMTIAPAEIAEHWPAAVFVSVLLVAGKTLGLSISAFLTGNGLRRAVQAGLSLSQIGEFAFIVVAVGISTGVVRGFLLPVVVGASCITAITGSWQIRASDRFASWIDSHLPKPMQTFISFYEAWIVHLRTAARPDSIWQRLRRPLILLVVDTVAVAAIAIGASAGQSRVVGWIVETIDLEPRVALLIVIAVAIALAGLFVFGIARGAVRLAWVLAAVIIPGRTGSNADGKMDLGHAPRRALVMTLELAIVLTLGLPLAVLVQPLVPGGGVLVLGVIVVLALATRRSITDFDRHVHAGSALIVEVLSRQGTDNEAPQLAEVSALLPGFGDLSTVVLATGTRAIGKTLAELDLRAKTGASVLAITREGGGTANPSPTEPLRAGDVLAMAGSIEAIAAARDLLLAGP